MIGWINCQRPIKATPAGQVRKPTTVLCPVDALVRVGVERWGGRVFVNYLAADLEIGSSRGSRGASAKVDEERPTTPRVPGRVAGKAELRNVEQGRPSGMSLCDPAMRDSTGRGSVLQKKHWCRFRAWLEALVQRSV